MQMRLHGTPPPRTCCCLLLSRASAAHYNSDSARRSLLAAQMRLHGARGTDAVDATTTHLLLSSASTAPLEPAAVLGAVRAQAGGAAGLRALRAGLQRGSLQLVTDRCAARLCNVLWQEDFQS